MLTYAWGERTAARASLFGEVFDQDQAFALGMFDELLPADQVLDRAVAVVGGGVGNGRITLTSNIRPSWHDTAHLCLAVVDGSIRARPHRCNRTPYHPARVIDRRSNPLPVVP